MTAGTSRRRKPVDGHRAHLLKDAIHLVEFDGMSEEAAVAAVLEAGNEALTDHECATPPGGLSMACKDCVRRAKPVIARMLDERLRSTATS